MCQNQFKSMRLVSVTRLILLILLASLWLPQEATAYSKNHIIQTLNGTDRSNLGSDLKPALDNLEAQAESDVANFHELPDDGNQHSRLLDWGRGEIRSHIYARLLEIAEADSRTDEEQVLAEAFANEWHQYHLHSLQLALDEYDKWKANPCGYVPPEGFSYDPDPNGTLCDGSFSLSELFYNVQPPSQGDFEAYGQALAGIKLKEADGSVATTLASRGLQFAAITTGVSGAALVVLIATAEAVLPFVVTGAAPMIAGAAGPGLVATLAAAGATILGAFLIILAGVIIAVIQGFNVFDAAAIPVNLQQAIDDAQTRPPLVQVLNTERGREEFFNAFMLSTLPDFASDADAPPPDATDDWFVVWNADHTNPVTSDSLTFYGQPLYSGQYPIAWTLRLTHGWFVTEGDIDVPGQGTQPISGLSLAIDYIGWDWGQGAIPDSTQFQARTAWRVGRRFYVLPKGGDPTTDGRYQDEIRFLEPSGDSYNFRLAGMDGDDTPPVVTSDVTGTLGENGWYVSPVTVDWTITDPDTDILYSSPSGCPPETYTYDINVAKVFFCSATSRGGTTEASVGVKIDQVPPTISGTGSPAANAAGWNNTDIAVQFTCTDPFPASGVATCGPDTTLSIETPQYAINSVGTATDNAGNTGYGSAGPFWIDKTPPTITGVLAPQPNANGWYQAGPVDVSFECSDSVSGIKTCTDGSTTVENEGADQPVTGTAVDIADNSATKTVNVHIDGTPPTISASPAPAPNVAGWNNSDVTVSFQCADSLSGVDTCTSPVALTDEGADQTAEGSVTDLAGNSASTTSAAINIDKTAPTIDGSRSPLANGAGWNNSSVTVSFSCDDTLSGVLSCQEPVLLGSEGAGQYAEGTAYDLADNSQTTAVENINIDLTSPSISAAASPSPNAAGWNSSDVTVSFTCSDALSGVDSCTSPVFLTGDGAGQTVPGTATDKAGNSNSTTSAAVNIDKTRPTITGSAYPSANSAGWNNSAVTVTFTCNDATSGIQSCTSPEGLTSEGTGQSASGSATDKAGNSNSTTVAGIDIDLTPPDITITSPPTGSPEYLLNEAVIANWTASDALSGLASATGSSASGDPIDTSTDGLQSFTVDAVDNAGNVAYVAREYTVLSPTEAIQDIEDAIQALVSDQVLKPKQSNGLLQPLNNAIRSYEKGNVSDSCNQLAEFVTKVYDKTPKPIDTNTADELIGAAMDIATISLNCSW